MRDRRSQKWVSWRNHIVSRCNFLTQNLKPPIPLRDISKRCYVKEVIFQPMLVEGGLAIDDDGFVVYVRCDEEAEHEWSSAFHDTFQAGRSLPGRVRFSLAHELVHTFFYDVEQRPFRNKLDESHYKEVDSLEAACNFGAAQLLMPDRQFRSDAEKIDVLSVAALRRLRKTYHVSYECLVHRMTDLQTWTHKKGLVAYLQDNDKTFLVKAAAKTASVSGLFGEVAKGADHTTLTFCNVACYEKIRTSSDAGGTFEYEYRMGQSVKTERLLIEYCRTSTSPNCYLVTVHVLNRTAGPSPHFQ